MRGFQETIVPKSDSPTISAEALRTVLAIAANEKFNLVTLDVTSAFLQGKEIQRELFAEPPKEIKRPGVIWKLEKAVMACMMVVETGILPSKRN